MNVEIRVEIIIFFSSVFRLSSVAEKEKGTNPTFIPTDLFNKTQNIMSKIKPTDLVESMSGKLCGHSEYYFFRKNGKVFSGRMCNPSTKEPTANQLAQRQKFATARANAKTALANSEQKAAYMEAFKKQKKYSDFSGYVFAMEYAKLND